MVEANTILVATDFSANAQNAYHYACGIAPMLKAKIQIVHVGSPVLAPVEALNENKPDRIEQFAQQMPQEFANAGLEIETKKIAGFSVAAELEKLTRDPSILLVVMGTRGSHSIVEKLIGSVSSRVAQKAYCPVLLIPPRQEYRPFKNILYASNYESADEEMLEQIIGFTRLFKANLHFVNVQKKGNDSDTVENIIFNQIFEKGDPDFSFNLVQLKEDTIIPTLHQYAAENNVDLVVLVNRQRSFLESLFQQSLTQQMALHTTLPLMVFHIEQEEQGA